MAITTSDLNQALNRAKTLMSPEGERMIDFAQKANSGNMDANGDFIMDESIRGMAERRGMSTTPVRRTQSKLPKAILESLQNNPIDTTGIAYDSGVGNSILDEMNIPAVAPQQNYQPAPRQTYQAPQQPVYQPQYIPQQTYVPQQQYMPNGIDYNIIKEIVSECIRENMNEIKETLLKESNVRQIRVGNSNKIQLVDSKGNLYESTLAFKRNIAKK